MKPYQIETTMGVGIATLVILVAVLFTDIVSNFNYKKVTQVLKSDAMKLTNSIENVKAIEKESEILTNSDATGEIIVGDYEEIEKQNIEKMNSDVEKAKEEKRNRVVYDGLTLGQLSDKLNRSLKSTLAGKGELYATKSIELGLDPYMTVAITLLETGCNWECSTLVKQCNNVGGQKGSPSCNGGSYMRYNTLDEGIEGFLNNIYYNYYSKGLTTPELMNSKYAASNVWAQKVNKYISKIRAT